MNLLVQIVSGLMPATLQYFAHPDDLVTEELLPCINMILDSLRQATHCPHCLALLLCHTVAIWFEVTGIELVFSAADSTADSKSASWL